MRTSSCTWSRSILLGGWCTALVISFWARPAVPQVTSTTTDPIPLRRVLIAPERVPAELEKVANGILKKLSYAEFQKKLKAAADAGQVLKNPPRLTETSYSAILKGMALEGNAEWKLYNPGKAGILALTDLSLALKKEEKIQFTRGPTDAILGDLNGTTLGLLVNNPGHDSVVFAWTARGDLDPDGRLRFKLKLPRCPIAALELTLPAHSLVRLLSPGRAFCSRRDKEGADKTLSRWAIHFSGQAEVDLLIQRTDSSVPLVLTRLESEQILSPGRVRAKFKYRIEVLHNVARKLYFECDRGLAPFNVSILNTDLIWKLHEIDGRRLLVLELREPKLSPEQPLPALAIDCLAPLPSESAWTSPALRLVKVLPWGKSGPDEVEHSGALADPRLVDAFPRGETLTLQVHPEIQLARWKAGTFRLVGSEMKADRTRVLTLTGNDGARPTARVRSQGFVCLARQNTWWQIGPRGSTLTSHIRYEPARGRAFQLRLGVPPGWEVDELHLGPDDRLLRGWAPLADKNRSLLLVDLERALQPQAPAQLTIRLRSPSGRAVPSAGQALAFPDVEPLDARFRSGVLGISVNALRADSRNASVPLAAPDEAHVNALPWDKQPLTFFFPFRASAQPARGADLQVPHPAVTGSLFLQPHVARVRASCETDVSLTPDRAAIEIRLHLQPEVGNPRHVDYYASAPVSGPWRWETVSGTNYVRKVVPLLPELLGLGHPLDAARLVVRQGGGRWWRLTLARPLTEAVTVKTSFQNRDEIQRVPLLSLPAADAMDGEIALYLAGADLTEVKAAGLRETVPHPRARTPGRGEVNVFPATRAYRYASDLLLEATDRSRPSLTVKRRARAAGRSGDEVIDQCRLTTYVKGQGRLQHHFSFQVWGWQDRTLIVRLPAGATLRAAKAYGRWVPSPTQAETPEGTVVEFNVAAGVTPHPFEIVYASGDANIVGGLWSRVTAPAPLLPLKKPLAFQRIWRLAPGVLPLLGENLRRLPGAEAGPGFSSFEALLASLGREMSAQAPPAANQRQLLLKAEARLRGEDVRDHEGPLGEVLSRLAFELAKERGGLVVDAKAFAAAGLHADSVTRPLSKVAPGPGATRLWAAWDLVSIPCRAAPLLTTRRQLEAWQGGAEGAAPASATVEAAVSEATVHGHDSSGRFHTVADWLAPRGAGAQFQFEAASSLLSDDERGGGEGWTAWEPVAGAELEEDLWVVRQGTVPVTALALAAGVTLAALRMRRRFSRRWQFRMLMVWLAGAGLALLWLPTALRDLGWWPGVAGLVVGLTWYLCSTFQTHRQTSSAAPTRPEHARPSTLLGAGVLALICTATLVGRAAAPAPHTVLLVEDPKTPSKLSVLIPPELDDLLGRLARRGVPGLHDAVLLSADYRGIVLGDRADFEVDFQVYCFKKEAILQLPLDDVVLKPRGPLGEPALFAGKPAYPVARAKGETGYAVPLQVEKPDVYTLEMRFTTEVVRTGAERDLRMTIPKLAQCRLTLELPTGHRLAAASAGAGVVATGSPHDQPRSLHAETGFGAAHVSSSSSSRRLETQLGRVGSVHIQWREPASNPRPVIQLQEMYLWDLRQADSTLSGVLHYKVTQGPVSQLDLGLAEGIEVRSVEISRESSPDGSSTARLLKEWRLTGTGNNRKLVVDFLRPVTGSVLLILELVPHLPAQPGPLALFLPMPGKGVTTLPGYLGYRVEGTKALPDAEHLGVTSIKPAAFLQKWRQAVRKSNDPGAPSLAYSFLRTSQGAAALRIALAAPRMQARQELRWQVGLHQADLHAQAVLTSSSKDLMLVEWDVPGVVVAEVSGPAVWDWTQTAARIQIWLKAPSRQTTIDVRGWLHLPAAGLGPRKLALPSLGFPEASVQETRVGIHASGGFGLEPGTLRQLSPVPPPPRPSLLADCEHVYVAQEASYGAEVIVRPAQANVRSLTWIEAQDHELQMTSVLEYEMTKGELRMLRVRLRGWLGDKVIVEAPGAVQVDEKRLGRSERIWTIQLKVGASLGKPYVVKLSGKMALDVSALALMPDVADASAPIGQTSLNRMERWLAVVGPRLATVRTRDLVAGTVTATRLWKKIPRHQRESIGRTWRIASERWQLQVRHQTAPGTARLDVLLNEQAAAVVDGRRWLHQAVYWLFGEGAADVRISLPPGASALGVDVDGAPEPLPQPGPDRLRLALAAGPRIVRIFWTFPDSLDPLPRPNLALPRLLAVGSEVKEARPLWTVHVPPGYRVENPRGLTPASAAESDFRRAEGEHLLTSLLVERGGDLGSEPLRGQLLASQERFLWYWRRAHDRMGQSAWLAPFAVSESPTMAAALEKLAKRSTHLLQSRGVPALGSEARQRTHNGAFLPLPDDMALKPQESASSSAFKIDLPERGTPTFWTMQDKGGAPDLELTTGEEERSEHALVATWFLLCILLGAWALSLIPHLLSGFQKAWPEQIILLGWLVWQVVGFPIAGIALMGMGGLARLFPFFRWFSALFSQGAARVPHSSGSGSSS